MQSISENCVTLQSTLKKFIFILILYFHFVLSPFSFAFFLFSLRILHYYGLQGLCFLLKSLPLLCFFFFFQNPHILLSKDTGLECKKISIFYINMYFNIFNKCVFQYNLDERDPEGSGSLIWKKRMIPI